MLNLKDGSMNYTPVFFYYLLLRPKNAILYLLRAKEEEHMGIALATAAIAFIFDLIGKAIALKKDSLITFFLELNIIPYIIGFFGNILLICAIWYFVESFIGDKNFSKFPTKNRGYLLFKLICFTYFPFVFLPALSVLALFLNPLSPSGVYFLLRLILTFWVIYLQIIVLKILFELKTTTAFLLYILPIIALVAFFIIKAWMFVSSFAIKSI